MVEIESISKERDVTDMKCASSSGNKACCAMHELDVRIKTLCDLIKTIDAKWTSSSGDKASSVRQEVEEDANLLKETEKKEENLNKENQTLIRMMVKNDVKAQRNFLKKHRKAWTAEIDDFGSTIFHFIVQKPPNTATIELLKEFVKEVSPETLKKINVNGLTAIHIAACAGNTEALQVFANNKNKSLLSIQDSVGSWLPIHHAAYWGREKTVQYLLSKTDWQAHVENSASDLFYSELLLELLVDSNLHDLALKLLKEHQHLAVPDKNGRWERIVNKLAQKSLAFKSGRKLGFWESLIYSNIPVNDDDQYQVAWPTLDDDIEMQNTNNSKKIPILPQMAAKIGALEQKLYTLLWTIPIQLIPYIKSIHDRKHRHSRTLTLVREMISKVPWTYNKATKYLKKPVLTAARLGIHEFVNEVLEAYPNSVLFYDKDRHNIFLLAVLHRKENVFRLIHDQVASIKDHTNYIRDISQHNILHLAGTMLASPSEVPGAALQMQRELQWFKGIRHFSPTSLQEQQNAEHLTPRELFTKEHKNLMEKGEKWMRDTATSSSVVGALIITIVFAAAFTVPGGFNQNGVPIYLNKTYFRIFAVSVALALFASTTSVQIFLGMLTSRYAEDDFLRALPNKLIIGLMTLFFSSTSMMVAFGAAFCILLSHPWKWVIILICLLGCIPATFFAWTQFPLLVDIIRSTYGPGIISPKENLCMRILKYRLQDPYLKA